MNRFAFTFNFALDTTDEQEENDDFQSMDFFFCIKTDDEGAVRLSELVNSDEFYNFISDNEEEYGIHDVSFGTPYFCGFTSYEVEQHNTFNVFKNIKDWFTAHDFDTGDGTTYLNMDDAQERYVKENLSDVDQDAAIQYFWSN